MRSRTPSSEDVGPFAAFVEHGACTKAEVTETLRRLALRGVDRDQLWSALVNGQRLSTPVATLLAACWWEGRAVRSALAVRRARTSLERWANAGRGLLGALRLVGREEPCSVVFPAGHRLKPTRREVGAAGLTVTEVEAFLAASEATMRAWLRARDHQAPPVRGRHAEQFSERGRAAAALADLGVGVKIRGRLLQWAQFTCNVARRRLP